VLEFVEEPLDAVSHGVGLPADLTLHFAVGLGWDHRIDTSTFEVAADGVAIVAFVGQHRFRVGQVVVHQVRVAGHVRRLARGQAEANGKALRIRPGVDLGREPTARTANTVAMNPPLPPAACWCARTMVLSIICIVLSEASLSVSAARITSQTAPSVHRRYWRKTEFQLPISGGRSRQAAPVRVTHRIASSTRR
jgi:hypothetical protein